nr:MAG TPA: hypothetical protein [Bacteriophage sp.]
MGIICSELEYLILLELVLVKEAVKYLEELVTLQ